MSNLERFIEDEATDSGLKYYERQFRSDLAKRSDVVKRMLAEFDRLMPEDKIVDFTYGEGHDVYFDDRNYKSLVLCGNQKVNRALEYQICIAADYDWNDDKMNLERMSIIFDEQWDEGGSSIELSEKGDIILNDHSHNKWGYKITPEEFKLRTKIYSLASEIYKRIFKK